MANNARPIEYSMTKKMFNSILETKGDSDKSSNPYEYVMKVLNDSYTLRGTVTKLHITTDN